MNIKNIFWQHNICKIIIVLLASTIFVLVMDLLFDTNSQFVILINTIVITYVISFVIGIYYQVILKEELSKEHFAIIKHKDEFNKSGIIQYYGSFKDSFEDIRQSIRKSKEVSIYIAYGSTILNSLNEEIRDFLIHKDNNLKLYMLDENNKIIPALSELWGYENDRIKNKLKESKELIKKIKFDLENNYIYHNNIEIINLLKYPVNYSLYMCDQEIYFVPSKHHESKLFIPIVIKAQKTIDKNALYNKLESELQHIYNETKKNNKKETL